MAGSSWRLAPLILLPCLALPLGFWLWRFFLEERLWLSMEKRIDDLETEMRSIDSRRSILRGDPLEGNAWDDYMAAYEEYKKARQPPLMMVLAEYFSQNPKADPAQVQAILDTMGTALEKLQSGARRSWSRCLVDWTLFDSFEDPAYPGLHGQWLAFVAACEARFRIQEGRVSEGVDLLLAMAQYGRDVGGSGDFISEVMGIAIVWMSFDELLRQMQAGRIPEIELRTVSQALELLDRHFFLHAAAFRGEVLRWGNQVLQHRLTEYRKDTFDSPGDPPIPTWRQLYSRRILEAEGFLALDRWMQQGAHTDTLAYDEERILWNKLRSDADAARLPYADMCEFGPSRSRRERLAQLRMVRTAAHFLATGEVLTLKDPLGADLGTRQTGNTLTVWSRGKDGVDDGGLGDWSLNGPDITLEVTR